MIGNEGSLGVSESRHSLSQLVFGVCRAGKALSASPLFSPSLSAHCLLGPPNCCSRFIPSQSRCYSLPTSHPFLPFPFSLLLLLLLLHHLERPRYSLKKFIKTTSIPSASERSLSAGGHIEPAVSGNILSCAHRYTIHHQPSTPSPG